MLKSSWNIKARILKMYSRSAKGGEKGDPNRNPWLAKMPLTRPGQIYILNHGHFTHIISGLEI
jgi:hypothetical protein